jgi:hypothetical protein
MLSYLPILIPLGLALFILRAQLLRVAIREDGIDNLHDSKVIGAASGWASLFGAIILMVCAIIAQGAMWGLLLVVIGLALGVVGSAVFLPTLGSTNLMGHHGGEGNRSIADFNRRYGPGIAFAVAAIALLCLYVVLTFRL